MKDYNNFITSIQTTLDQASAQGRIKPATASALAQGQLRLMSSSIFAKKEITGQGGLLQVIKQSDSLEFGVRNIDKARLSDGELFIVMGIVLGWFQGNVTAPVNNYVFGLKDGANTVDPALKNAELIVGQNDNALFRGPVDMLLSEEAISEPIQKCAFSVAPYIFLTDKEKVNIDIQFPEAGGVASPAGEKIYVNITLLGVRTLPRA